jgi:hypothetical protein
MVRLSGHKLFLLLTLSLKNFVQPRGHINLGYPVLAWDLKFFFEALGVKHSFHLVYPTHIGINFLGI